jgi:beta-ring hydroxylase
LSFIFGISFPFVVKKSLSKLGVPSAILNFLFEWVDAHEECAKIPEVKGSINAIRSEAFFIPLYELYLRYGGIFRLNFGPKVCFF